MALNAVAGFRRLWTAASVALLAAAGCGDPRRPVVPRRQLVDCASEAEARPTIESLLSSIRLDEGAPCGTTPSVPLPSEREHAVDALVHGLRYATVPVRLACARAIRRIGPLAEAEAVAIATAITNHVAGLHPVRCEILSVLACRGRSGDTRTASVVRSYLESHDPEIGRLAASVLLTLRDDTVLSNAIERGAAHTQLSALAGLLYDPSEHAARFRASVVRAASAHDASVRLEAVKLLSSWPDSDGPSLDALAERLAEDQSTPVRVFAAGGLGARARDVPVRIEPTLALLLGVLDDSSPELRAQAAASIGTLRGRTGEILARLRRAASDDPDDRVRREASRALRLAEGR